MNLLAVSRWNIVHVNRPQSVAEHSFQVVLLVRAICMKIPTLSPVDRNMLIMRAIDHDMEEVFTGDMPSTSKQFKMPMSRMDCILKLADLIEAEHYLAQYGGTAKRTIDAYVWIGDRISDVLAHCSECGYLGVSEAVRQVRDELVTYGGGLYDGPQGK